MFKFTVRKDISCKICWQKETRATFKHHEERRNVKFHVHKWSSNICVDLGKRTNSLEVSLRFGTNGKLLNNDLFKKIY
jgi:hypothetical protein